MFSSNIMIYATCLLAIALSAYVFRENLFQNRKKLPLMKLPPEIRLLIFEHLLEDELRQSPMPKLKPTHPPLPSSITYAILSSLEAVIFPPPRPSIQSLPFVSKRIRSEFMAVYCRRATIAFTIDAASPDPSPLWRTPPAVLSALTALHLRIRAQPDLAASSSFDPLAHLAPAAQNNNQPRQHQHRNQNQNQNQPEQQEYRWAVRDRLLQSLRDMARLRRVRVTVVAAGNQLCNPVLLWHFASQAFKVSGVRVVKRIEFELDGLDMKTNYLERNEDKEEQWEWRCEDGHVLHKDEYAPQSSRSFGKSLCRRCATCAGDGDGDNVDTNF